MKRIINIGCLMVLLACLAILESGCGIIRANTDLKNYLESSVIVGRVESTFPVSTPIIVAARSLQNEKKVVAYTVLHEPGEYELMVPPGSYHVFAYEDKNSDLIYSAGEPFGSHSHSPIVQVSNVGVVYDIDIVLKNKEKKVIIPNGYEITEQKLEKFYSRQAGAITNLEDERFAEENGAKGFWEPGSFFKEFGGNIFFLEKYNPGKVPILFIHGAGGSPRGWKYFIDNLDRTRYQPWLFYYPTGARIDSTSHLLMWKLINLQMKYHFSTFHIVAHSMGGLVARSFLMNSGSLFPGVKLFITLATPWGGDSMAEYGVAQSPVVIPSWVDMQPEGDFIKSLYRAPLPQNVQFYLLYGYRGTLNPLHINNDGTIAMNSLLDYRSQGEAKMIYAFNEDHASIALSKETVERFKAILNDCDSIHDGKFQESHGDLKVHFRYDYHVDGEQPRPMLILTPNNSENQEIVLYLRESDNGIALGPFPSGDYAANLVTTATAGRPDKQNIPISIQNGSVAEMDISFSPDGAVGGCVASKETKEYGLTGMPDYKYRGKERIIEVQSVHLQGNGVDRTIVPKRGEYISDKNYMIARTDFAYNECFHFYSLARGNYVLSINTEKYRPAVYEISVIPGRYTFLQNIELQ